MSVGPVKIERQISLPFNQAFKIALRNITIRLGRALITGAGTMLGIAFLMSVVTSYLVQEALAAQEPGARMTPEEVQKSIWLVVMSLLVSVVGITNSMLMSVTERYKEIGTMKCLGALDNFIIRLFLLESGMLGFFGSLSGALIGGLFMLLTSIGKTTSTGGSIWGSFNWGSFFMGLGACIVIGTLLSIVAAVPPAMRAAKMVPADAMRSEI
ncbi:MAG: FtsX-like permease family protein [Armatimonadota bacterium]|nr:FtsX-like permease family protein [Armatimonadota bacterium]